MSDDSNGVIFRGCGGHNGSIIYLPLFCLVVCINIYRCILSDVFSRSAVNSIAVSFRLLSSVDDATC